MAEWVYLVNGKSSEWGYDVTPLEFFSGHREAGVHAWTLSRFYKEMMLGDFLWVRATLPIGAFIGLGQVSTDLKAGQYGATFGVEFDSELCRRMSANPIPGVLEKHTQVPRKLTPSEQHKLHRRAGALPKQPPVPVGKVRRLHEVVARQGQAVFRAELMIAYKGACAVTGTAVAEVLQAAHIEPYNGAPTNHVTNGLLLRADIHDLFDRGLLWVTGSMSVGVAASLDGTTYAKLRGNKLRLPRSVPSRPDRGRLRKHRQVIAGQAQ